MTRPIGKGITTDYDIKVVIGVKNSEDKNAIIYMC
jgi:hypothetical protein